MVRAAATLAALCSLLLACGAEAEPETAAPGATSVAGGPAPPNAPADTATAATAAAPLPNPPPCCHVAVGTVVEIELAQQVGTKELKTGDRFAIRLAQPLVIDGAVVLAGGAAGEGEVVFADRPGMGGRAARLVLAARYVEQDGVRVSLRSFRLGAAGRDETTAALVVGEAGALAFPPLAFVGLAVTGGNVEFPAGTLANAKVASDVDLRPVTASETAPQPPPPAATPASAPPMTNQVSADKGSIQ